MSQLSVNPGVFNKQPFRSVGVRPTNINDLSSGLASASRLQANKTKKQKNITYQNSFAKKNVLKALAKIKFGSLVLKDNGEVYQFGKRGEQPSATVTVNDSNAYSKFAFGGNIGGAEAYILSYWDTPELIQVTRLLAKNIEVLSSVDGAKSAVQKMVGYFFHLLNLNSLDGSKRNICAHYDLGNDFFSTFLDSTMMYSSAIFETPEQDLHDAAVNKLEVICQKLDLKSDDHLVEIGTGWGGMAIYAATHYGCKVSTTTISEEQYDYTLNKVKLLGLEDKIQVLKKDYRLLEGKYDKLVSIEMIEAVGKEHYSSYFEKCSSLLKEDGLMLIQAITIPDQRYDASLKSVDFIQKYIFPGGRLPSNKVIADNLAAHTDLQVVDHHDIGLDYSKTIFHWRKLFLDNISEVKSQGFDETFCRMWEYYLCYCEGGFQERAISTVQYVMAKPHTVLSKAR